MPPINYATGTELFPPIMITLGDHRGQLEREREGLTQMEGILSYQFDQNTVGDLTYTSTVKYQVNQMHSITALWEYLA